SRRESLQLGPVWRAMVWFPGSGYMRRRLGGRQPLCGTGVTSAIEMILRPSAFKARTADSRPGPGPLMRTSRFFTPCSCAARPAASAATCAAKGVDLRDPLKPAAPEVAQESALPWRSVIVMIVLLNDACTCAMPSETTFLAFFRTRAAAGGFAIRFPSGYQAVVVVALFVSRTALRGPLRVRALVRVRW